MIETGTRVRLTKDLVLEPPHSAGVIPIGTEGVADWPHTDELICVTYPDHISVWTPIADLEIVG